MCLLAFFFLLPSPTPALFSQFSLLCTRFAANFTACHPPRASHTRPKKCARQGALSFVYPHTGRAGRGRAALRAQPPPAQPSSQEAALLVGHELRQRHPRRRRRRPVRNEPSKTDDTAVAVFALALAAGARECLARVVPPRARLVPRPLAGRPSERARWGGGGRARAARLRWYGSRAPPASPAARMALSSSGGPGGAGRGRAARLPGGGISRAADRRAG